MAELIDREATYEVLTSFYHHKTDIQHNALREALNKVPSAQPERLTDDDFETIRIHLNAYKEKLCNQHRWEEADEYQRIIDRFMSFASAQPDVPDTNVGDMISRQAAIDAISSMFAPTPTQKDMVENCLEIIENLPSTDAVEVVRCKDCKHHIFDGDRWLCKLLSNNYEPVVEMDDDGYCSHGERKDG